MKVLKWIGIVLLGLFLLGLLLPNNDKKKNEVDTEKIVSPEAIAETATVTVDSAKIKALKSLFKHKKDEFSEGDAEWITPIASPRYRNENGTYCYFSKDNLRFVFQYHSDEWLFIKDCKFLIDDKPYNFIPEEVKRDNDETGITEWFDVNVNSNNQTVEIIKALANAKTAKVKLIGNNYSEIKNITSKQLLSIKNTLEYYKALGNSID
jgi:hypothetical protein